MKKKRLKTLNACYNSKRKRKIRRLTYLKEKGICHICKEHVPYFEMTIDHVIPLSKGGTHNKENLKIAHLECNQKKSNKIIYEPKKNI